MNDSNDKQQQQQSPDNNSDLLRRAESLLDRTSKTESSNIGTKSNGVIFNKFSALLSPILQKLHSAQGFFGKITSVLSFIFSLISQWFNWAAYRRENGKIMVDANGSTIFSGKRFALTSLLTLLIFIAAHAALRATYYYSTQFSEIVYITGKQEIVTGEVYQFGGCTSLPCSTANDNGKFYLIESSLYFPRLVYPEQEVYANIPQQNAACEVSGYGFYFRNLRWIYKSAQLYQHVANVLCRPYTKDELERAVSQGSIVNQATSEESKGD